MLTPTLQIYYYAIKNDELSLYDIVIIPVNQTFFPSELAPAVIEKAETRSVLGMLYTICAHKKVSL